MYENDLCFENMVERAAIFTREETISFHKYTFKQEMAKSYSKDKDNKKIDIF